MVPESIEKPFVSIFWGFNANLIRLFEVLFKFWGLNVLLLIYRLFYKDTN